jgi:hypothetical protein
MHTYLITVCNYNPTIDLAKNVSKECVFPELFKKERCIQHYSSQALPECD